MTVGVRLTTRTPLLVASGSGRWGIDLATVTDARGIPYVPGSSLRGRLRHLTGGVARALGLDVCGEPSVERSCPKQMHAGSPGAREVEYWNDNGKSCTGYFCPVCRLFGNVRLPSRVSFTDLRATRPASDPVAWQGAQHMEQRTHVSINRRRRTAEEGKLFVVEAAAPAPWLHTYCGTIIIRLPEEDAALCGLLYAATRQLYTLGGRNTAGMGWLDDRLATMPSDPEAAVCGIYFDFGTYGEDQARADLEVLRQAAVHPACPSTATPCD